MARLEITSLAFMFVCVPLPVCQMRSGKCSSSLPAITSSAACAMQLRFFGRKLAEVLIHQRGGLFQNAEGADQLAAASCRGRCRNGSANGPSARRSSGQRAPRSCPCCRIQFSSARVAQTRILRPGSRPSHKPPCGGFSPGIFLGCVIRILRKRHFSVRSFAPARSSAGSKSRNEE